MERVPQPFDESPVPAVPPADPNRPGVAPGAATQDDPDPVLRLPERVEGAEGDLTLVAVFQNLEQASAAAQDLERRGIEVGLIGRRGDGPEQGLRPGNIITGDGYGLSAEEESPPADRPMGAGVAVGATIGATAGLLAATYVFPPVGAIFATGSLIATLTGAGLGTFLGGLFQYGANDEADDASLYAGQVRRGGVLLLARVEAERADEVRRLLDLWNPLELRVQ